jgi:hypothetical protein
MYQTTTIESSMQYAQNSYVYKVDTNRKPPMFIIEYIIAAANECRACEVGKAEGGIASRSLPSYLATVEVSPPPPKNCARYQLRICGCELESAVSGIIK